MQDVREVSELAEDRVLGGSDRRSRPVTLQDAHHPDAPVRVLAKRLQVPARAVVRSHDQHAPGVQTPRPQPPQHRDDHESLTGQANEADEDEELGQEAADLPAAGHEEEAQEHERREAVRPEEGPEDFAEPQIARGPIEPEHLQTAEPDSEKQDEEPQVVGD